MHLFTQAALLILASMFLTAPVPNPERKVTLLVVLENGGPVGFQNFTPDGQGLIVAIPSKSRMIVWDLDAKKQRVVMEHPNTTSLIGAEYSRNGKLLITVGEDADIADRAPSRLRVWDPVTGKEKGAFPTRPSAWCALSPDAKVLAVSDWDSWKNQGAVKLFDAATLKELATLLDVTVPVYRVGFSPDGQTLVTSSWDHKPARAEARLWDVATRKVRATFSGSMGLMCFRYSPDGRTLATWSSSDRTEGKELKLWDAATGQLKVELKGCRDPVETAVFSPDSRLLATGGGTLHLDVNPHPDSGEVKLWDVATGKALASLKGHQDLVGAVAFSHDGRLLATGGGDGYLKRGELMLWDVAKMKRLAMPDGHTDVVNTVTFSPSGKVLASGSQDGTVRLWDVSGVNRP